jgi:hypothetical protein
MIKIEKQKTIATITIPDIKEENKVLLEYLYDSASYFIRFNDTRVFFFLLESNDSKYFSNGFSNQEWVKIYLALLDKVEEYRLT